MAELFSPTRGWLPGEVCMIWYEYVLVVACILFGVRRLF